ncbi:MAG: hypothetical protein ACOY0S_01670 [Patescibacteria group bacterium]
MRISKALLRFLKTNQLLVLTLLFLVPLADSLSSGKSSDLLIFGILALYFLFSRIYKISSKITFYFCLSLLGVMFVEFLLLGPAPKTEKAAVWLVLFLLLGIIQQWRE